MYVLLQGTACGQLCWYTAELRDLRRQAKRVIASTDHSLSGWGRGPTEARTLARNPVGKDEAQLRHLGSACTNAFALICPKERPECRVSSWTWHLDRHMAGTWAVCAVHMPAGGHPMG